MSSWSVHVHAMYDPLWYLMERGEAIDHPSLLESLSIVKVLEFKVFQPHIPGYWEFFCVKIRRQKIFKFVFLMYVLRIFKHMTWGSTSVLLLLVPLMLEIIQFFSCVHSSKVTSNRLSHRWRMNFSLSTLTLNSWERV